jgi:hypothetical protein
MRAVLLNAFACKESGVLEYCILNRALCYTNPRVSSCQRTKVQCYRKAQARGFNNTKCSHPATPERTELLVLS